MSVFDIVAAVNIDQSDVDDMSICFERCANQVSPERLSCGSKLDNGTPYRADAIVTDVSYSVCHQKSSNSPAALLTNTVCV